MVDIRGKSWGSRGKEQRESFAQCRLDHLFVSCPDQEERTGGGCKGDNAFTKPSPVFQLPVLIFRLHFSWDMEGKQGNYFKRCETSKQTTGIEDVGSPSHVGFNLTPTLDSSLPT
ncbi:hypothetical protein Y1Q_0013133 [Alligator mississippiensis]|uniref:Uncharacterized protein n=1 Tax=Alligator mississippiensis TaxID=8496 RepID=A0A151NH00_ALLMI|nr:hypothetical protein Y1Q_0013133 [Alligator mississippiensis]